MLLLEVQVLLPCFQLGLCTASIQDQTDCAAFPFAPKCMSGLASPLICALALRHWSLAVVDAMSTFFSGV